MSASWVLVPIAYFIGTLPTAQVVGRLFGHDPTVEGSGNPGASNMTRLAGRWAGGLVLTGDVVKAVIPVAAGYALDGRPLAVACGIAVVVGHIYPVQRRLRGGKGVATLGGVSIVLWPPVGLTAFVTWFVAVRITRRASVGSIVTTLAVVAGVAVSRRPLWEVAAVGGVAALVLLRHWSNLVRLVQRQEASI